MFGRLKGLFDELLPNFELVWLLFIKAEQKSMLIFSNFLLNQIVGHETSQTLPY